MQICHPGRQSFRVAGHRGIWASTIAPSAVPINLGSGLLERFIAALAWTAPREMTRAEVERVISQFVDTARLMADAGFSGIELHGAHGYLIGMFRGWFSGRENCLLMRFIIDQFLSGKVKLPFPS